MEDFHIRYKITNMATNNPAETRLKSVRKQIKTQNEAKTLKIENKDLQNRTEGWCAV